MTPLLSLGPQVLSWTRKVSPIQLPLTLQMEYPARARQRPDGEGRRGYVFFGLPFECKWTRVDLLPVEEPSFSKNQLMANRRGMEEGTTSFVLIRKSFSPAVTADRRRRRRASSERATGEANEGLRTTPALIGTHFCDGDRSKAELAFWADTQSRARAENAGSLSGSGSEKTLKAAHQRSEQKGPLHFLPLPLNPLFAPLPILRFSPGLTDAILRFSSRAIGQTVGTW